MENLEEGKFHGISRKQFYRDGLTIVDPAFHYYSNCSWHYHQNAHFAFTNAGNLSKHTIISNQLSTGCLLYNHSNESHCNSRYPEFVPALHVDMGQTL